MSRDTLPLDLYKANVELQLRITRLLQEAAHHWRSSGHHDSSESAAETHARIEGLLRSCHWQSLATLPSESFFRLFELCTRDMQFASEAAIQNQVAFISGLEQALENWHKSVSAAVGELDSGPRPAG